MTTYQNKSLWVNSSTNNLTTSAGNTTSAPEFVYKSLTKITWQVNDANGDPYDLSSAQFEFKINDTYNGTNLITVSNSSFTAISLAGGTISCIADFNQAAIETYLDEAATASAQCSLWATVGGTDYLLGAFECVLLNSIS